MMLMAMVNMKRVCIGITSNSATPTINAAKEPTVPGAFAARPVPKNVIKSLFKFMVLPICIILC